MGVKKNSVLVIWAALVVCAASWLLLLHGNAARIGSNPLFPCVAAFFALLPLYPLYRLANQWPRFRVGISFAFAVWCFLSVSAQAESRCHDPRGRETAIGGNTIYGMVFQNGKPLRNAQVKIYSSTGKTAQLWRTDQDGKFTTAKLRRGAYRVEIAGWGSAVVKVGSEQAGFGQQTINWTVGFGDDGCVGSGISTD